MDDPDNTSQLLRLAAARLFAEVCAMSPESAIRGQELDALIHEAEAREHRRAAFNARDANCYRLGSAFEPTGGLDLDPVALAGLAALGTTGLLLLVRVALDQPDASLVEHLRTLFRSPAGRGIRKWGVWSRWCWIKELYVKETDTFLASELGSDPKARWRTKPPSARQLYLVAEICADLQKEQQVFATRGAAFDWVRAQAGNPKFQREPAKPDLAMLAEAFA